MDWKVFAKTDRFYVREYEEETNLRCHLLLDASGSMSYGSEDDKGISKIEYGSRLAACLAYLCLRQTDSVGLTTFDTTVRSMVPPRGGASHTRQIIDLLGATTWEMKLSEKFFMKLHLSKARYGCNYFRLLGIFIILKGLAHFNHAKHDVVVFKSSRDELEFPFRSGRIRLP